MRNSLLALALPAALALSAALAAGGCSASSAGAADANSGGVAGDAAGGRADTGADLVGADAADAGSDAPPVERCPGGMLRGLTVSGSDKRALVDAIGAKHVHFWIHWDDIQPTLVAPFVEPADVTEARIAAFADGSAAGVGFAAPDKHLAEHAGKTMVLGIGSGWTVDMPRVGGKRITPDSIGREAYLGQLALYTRAVVRRYRGKVAGWQIENEPNVAGETVLWGWRAGAAWSDGAFVTRVLETLRAAVRAEDPAAFITINFHTDIHYEQDIVRWRHLVDKVGIDAYPNYLLGKPDKSALVGQRVRRARALADGKPVLVMETGFPTAPTATGFSEANQARYIRNVFAAVRDAGACGIYWFKLTSAEDAGSKTPPQENYWGVFRGDGTRKLGWQALADALRAP